MIIQLLSATAALAMAAKTTTPPPEVTPVVMGDGQIDGRKINPYSLEWRQCKFQEGAWVSAHNLTETTTDIGGLVLRITQQSKQANGVSVRTLVFVDRNTLSPLRLEQTATSADNEPMGTAVHDITDSGYTGRRARGEKSQDVAGELTNKMYNGAVLGLPLATLDYGKAPISLTSFIIGLNASYRTILHHAGQETWRHNGEDVVVDLIDVEWHHNEIGDVYPPGPDASGGRYWIAQNPPEGFPYVPKYKTDTYAIEFQQGTCPSDE